MSESDIYYLPGRGGRLETGLGQALTSRGLSVSGRESLGEFIHLSFQEQIELVAEDLKSNFWEEEARVVANSYGAYLFLHAQSLLVPFPGKVLLLSPIIGEFTNEDVGTHYIPPRSRQLKTLVESGQYPIPKNCDIHVGELDWQSNPSNVVDLGNRLRMGVTVVPGAGHMLPKAYVSELLDRWLK